MSLETNPSTGYSWEVTGQIEPVLKQKGEAEFKAEVKETPLAGSGGYQSFRFMSQQAGQVVLKLVYQRPWETGVQPQQTFTLTDIVK